MSEKNNSRAYNRKVSIRKALRKKRIAEEITSMTYDNLHQYSKNKVHCSCPMCNEKTNVKGAHNYKHSELKKLSGMENQEKEMGFTP